jgi:hypothetical protein
MPTAGATNLAGRLARDAGLRENRALAYKQAAVQAIRAKLAQFNALMRTHGAKVEEAEAREDAEREKKRGMLGAGIGGGLGAAGAVALAPATGGASLTALPSFVSGGAQVGSGVASSSPSDLATGFQAFQDPLTELFAENDPVLIAPGGGAP